MCRNLHAQTRKKSKYVWAIEYNRQVIGFISANYIDSFNNSCSIGYTIGSKFWNMGLATEAGIAVIDFFFSQIRVHRIIARHYDENLASGRVMQKIGMKKEATIRDEYYLNGRYTTV